jgi:hypothetical protein
MRDLWLRIRAHLIGDWHRCLTLFTVQLHLAALGYLTLYQLAPIFPPEVANMLPSPFRAPVVGIYSVLGIALRLISQRKKANG